MIGAITNARNRRQKSQVGYTLLELLVGMSITALILVPLMSWAILVMRRQPIERDGMMATAQSGLLGTMFPSDVSVAGQAWVSGMNEPWAADCSGGESANGSVQLVMISSGATVQKVVYTVAKSTDDAAKSSIWRRTCGVGSDDALISERQLFRGVRPGLTAVTCASQGGDAPCREITLTMTPLRAKQSVDMTATRRVDNNTTAVDALGNPLPVAVITLESLQARTATTPMAAEFSASRSTVGPGRTIASYVWEFEPDVVASGNDSQRSRAEFPTLQAGQTNRDFTVRLTITDDLDRANTAFLRLSSSNVDPVAVISRIAPNPVTVGDTVSFSALPVDGVPGSYDPDGSITRFDWLITFPQSDPSAPPREVWLTGPTVSYTTKEGDAGEAMVRLSVTDLQLAQATVSASFQIVDPTAPSTTTTVPVDPAGPLVAAFTDTVGATALVRDFDAVLSTGVDGGTAYAWNFGDGTSGTGRAVSHTYPNSGTFHVSLTLTTADNRTASVTRPIDIVTGPLPAPLRVRHNGTAVLWDPVAGARRYLVDFEFSTPSDCYRVLSNQAVGTGPNPAKVIPQNLCTNRKATTRARVGTDSGSSVTWSSWIVVPTINSPVSPTTTKPPVVK